MGSVVPGIGVCLAMLGDPSRSGTLPSAGVGASAGRCGVAMELGTEARFGAGSARLLVGYRYMDARVCGCGRGPESLELVLDSAALLRSGAAM